MDYDAPQAQRCVYDAPWTSYSLAWSNRPRSRARLALGSCIESESNRIQVVEVNWEAKRVEFVAEAEHPYPPTKLMWRPDDGSDRDFFASTGTTLNLWKLEEGQIKLLAKLAHLQRQQNGHLPPLTSFDWSASSHHKLGVSSVDTTCTIWNLEKQKIETQLIAHDKAVHDIAFSQVGALFASVGADGSVRLFDQRNLDHSMITYEVSTPLLRLAWNKINTNHIATIAMDQVGVIIIDIRRPSVALCTLAHNEACVNSITWAPHSRDHLLCGTDGGALIWDVKNASTAPESDAAQQPPRRPSKTSSPLVSYECEHDVYQVQWPMSQPDQIALGLGKQIEVLQV